MKKLFNKVLKYFLLFLLGFIQFSSFSQKTDSINTSFRVDQKIVTVGLSIAQIFKIEGAVTQFSASGYLYYSWKDSSLSYHPKNPADSFRILNKVLESDPQLEFVNGQKIEYDFESNLIIKPNGVVFNKKKFQGIFFSPMDLRKFPFDKQDLEFIIEPFLLDTNFYTLLVKPDLVTLGQNVHQDEWDFSAPKYTFSTSRSDPTGTAPFSRLTFKLKAERNWNFYVWNIMFYLFIFVLISTGVYYVPPTDEGTSVRITITMLLTVIAFHITLTDRIPTLSYRTFMDDLDYLSLAAILYNFIFVLFNRQLLLKGKEVIVGKIIYYHRFFFIPVLILTFFILLFLRLNFS